MTHMPPLRVYAELLSAYPSSLIYHIVTLITSQVILGIALVTLRQRRESPFAGRLVALASTFALTRLALIALAVLAQAELVWGQAVAPPLERFLDFVTLFVSIWALLPILVRYRRIARTLLAAGLVIGAGIYTLTAFLWLRRVLEGSYYNHYWQSSSWEVLSIAVLVPTLFVACVSRRDDWGLMACLLTLWLAGHSLEYTDPVVDSNAAGWVRLANLAAMPLFAAIVHRTALRAAPGSRGAMQNPIIRSLATLGQARQRGDIEAGLKSAAVALGATLDADVVAIASTVHDDPSLLRIAALHPPGFAARSGTDILFSVDDVAALARNARRGTGPAERRGPSDYAEPKTAATQAQRLFASLGYGGTGPLLVLPLRESGRLVGAIMAGNPVSRREWDDSDLPIIHAVRSALAATLAVGQQDRDARRDAELVEARRRQAELARRLTEMEEEMRLEQGQLAAVTAGRDEYRQRMEELAGKLHRYEADDMGKGSARPDIGSPVDLHAIISDAASSFETLFRERDLTLSTALRPDLPQVTGGGEVAGRIVGGVLREAQRSARVGSEIAVHVREVSAEDDSELPLDSVLLTAQFSEVDQAADHPKAESDDLEEVRALVRALEGFVWVERDDSGRTTLSLTLPVWARATPQSQHEGLDERAKAPRWDST